VNCRYPIAGEVVDSYRLRHGPRGPAGFRVTRSDLAAALRRQLNPRRARWQKPSAVVRALGLRRGQVVAEIGAGPGYFTPRLARAVGPSGHVYAVDPEAAVLEVLCRRLALRAGPDRRAPLSATPVLLRAAPHALSQTSTTRDAHDRGAPGGAGLAAVRPAPLRRRRAAAWQRLQPVPGRRTGALTLERPAVYGRRASSPLGPPGARPESRAPSPRTSKEEGHDVCAGRDLT